MSCNHATDNQTSQGQSLYLVLGECPKCGKHLGDNSKELDMMIDMLLNTEGKYYTANNWPYNAEEPNTKQLLQEARINRFKEWLYEKGFR